MSKFKKILAKNNITQRQLAKAVGLSYQIAKYLNVPMEELMEEEEK